MLVSPSQVTMHEEEFLKGVKIWPDEKIVQVYYDHQYANTALHYAAIMKKLNVVCFLMRVGGDMLSTNMDGLTPFHFAAYGGSQKVLSYLLQRNQEALNYQADKNQSSPLHEAVIGKAVQAVEFLLQNKAICDLQNKDGETPLHLAACQKSEGICSKLLKYGANVELKNKDGDTPLHLAVRSGSLPICQMLVKNGASLHTKNKKAENVLFCAVNGAGTNSKDDYYNLVTWLIEEASSLLLNRNKDGLTVLDVAWKRQIPLNSIALIQKKTQELQRQTLLKELDGKGGGEGEGEGGMTKIFICGHSRVGKTTLVQTLQQTGILSYVQRWFRDPDSPPSTEGVQITKSNFAGDKAVVWDFAGQMEYYFTHSLLLSTQSENVLYCIVFSLEQIQSEVTGNQSEAITQVLYWLRFLDVCKNNVINKAKVFLIGSHYDKLEMDNKEQVVKYLFKSIHQNIKDSQTCLDIDTTDFKMNCKSASDVQPLREKLMECMQAFQKSVDSTLPSICKEVMNELQIIRHNGDVKFLLWKDFILSVKKNLSEDVSCETLKTTIEYLHNISELLFFPDFTVESSASEEDSGLIILDIQWLCQDIFGKFGSFGLGKLPCTKETWTASEIVAILNVEGSAATILKVLEVLELLYSENGENYIVPAWLKEQMPRNIWTKHKCYNVYYGISYTWKKENGIISHVFFARLQMKLMKCFTQLRQDGTVKEKFVLWSNGIKCIHDTEALVQVPKGRHCINIAVRGYRSHNCEPQDSCKQCFEILEAICFQVESLFLRFGTKDEWKKLYLSPKELEANMGIFNADFTVYTMKEILDAEKSNTLLYNKLTGCDEKPCDVLISGHDLTVVKNLMWDASIRWLQADTVDKLCAFLDFEHPLGRHWKGLLEVLTNGTNQNCEALAEQAKREGLSPTFVLFQKCQDMTIFKLNCALSGLEREDCVDAINAMFQDFI
ncbi:death-associated protein kinase 1-like isoform X2 [Polypterus senegalus]|uniref:death-associated protein kinase 1-like isoform X2 n=1 Tax=Polypterus senegalus TaxID=55291 RepID=UPI0019659A01|nr:death-associated protein kinase 1-like isoform X2 [Polypterus senegalus]